jgi:hypothetical protein
MEDGHANSGAPAEIVRQLKRKNIPDMSEFLGAASLGEKTRVPGLQAADGLAFGAWHAEQGRLGPRDFVTVAPDVSVAKLKGRSRMKTPLFRCDIDDRELRILKSGFFSHVDFGWELAKRRKASSQSAG